MRGARRGSVYTVDIGYGPHHYVAVSNDRRNTNLGSFLAVRLTTKDKPALDSIVELAEADQPLIGRVLCDNLLELHEDEVMGTKGVLSPGTMSRVNDGLLAALGMDDLYTRARR